MRKNGDGKREIVIFHYGNLACLHHNLQGDQSIFLNFGACLLNLDGCFCRHALSGKVVWHVSNFALRFVYPNQEMNRIDIQYPHT